jgi:hypothetical protein
MFILKIIYQQFRLSDVMDLTSRKRKSQWIAKSIDTYMDFGAEAASTSTNSLGLLSTVFLEAPAAQGWARTTVLSMMRCSISGS